MELRITPKKNREVIAMNRLSWKPDRLCPGPSVPAVRGAWPIPEALKTLAIGSPAPDFKLPGVDGKTYSLADFAQSKVLFIIFTCNHCPTAQAYEGRIARLCSDYREKGVAVVAISPNNPRAVRLDELGFTDLGDSFEEMKIRAKDHDFALSLSLRRRNPVRRSCLRRDRNPPGFHLRRRPQAPLHRPVRRWRSEARQVPRRQERRRCPARRYRSRGKDHPRARLLDQVGRERSRRSQSRSTAGTPSPSRSTPIDLAGVARLAKNDTKKLRLINLWATWCGPCVAELPELVTMNRMYRGRNFELVTISLDDLAETGRRPASAQGKPCRRIQLILNVDDRDKFAEALDQEWPGPVPYTLLVAPGGKILYRKTGAIDPLEVKRAIVAYLGRTY